MDSTALMVTIGGGALIGLTLWFFFGGYAAPRTKAEGGRYTCPMHPWITGTDPAASCSICGMKLVRDGKS